MNKRLVTVIFIVLFLFSVVVVPQISNCQTATPKPTLSTLTPTPTEAAGQANTLDLLLIVGVVAVVVAVIGTVSAFVVVKRRVNEKSLRKFSSHDFEDWVIKRFNGKPSDPSSGVNGFTEGGQPLLIIQSDQVGLDAVNDFVDVLVEGKAQKGTIVAFNFSDDTLEGRVKAMDNEIELSMLRVNELVNKRFSSKIKSIAHSQVSFEAPVTYAMEDQMTQTESVTSEKTIGAPQKAGLVKPRVFISKSNTKVADQVKRMLDFLQYDYVIGDKEETTVPISDNKFGLMKGCDCAIINIAAVEQERRYSGLYVLNSNVTSEINAAYLKYNTQVVLLVEKKVDLPANFKGLKRVEYDSDDLSFNAAMDLEKALSDFKKL